MKTLTSLTLLSCILLFGGCNSESDREKKSVKTDSSSKIKIGMKKDQVIKELGQPSSKQTIVKSDEPIWGVIEKWWYELENKDKVEIWDYKRDKGTFSVYFLNDSDKVWHTSFVGKDVVF